MMHTSYKQFVYTLLFLTSFSQVFSQSIQELQKMKAEYEKFQCMDELASSIIKLSLQKM